MLISRKLGADSRHRFLKRNISKFVKDNTLHSVTHNIGKNFYKRLYLHKDFIKREAALIAAYSDSSAAKPKKMHLRQTGSRLLPFQQLIQKVKYDASDDHDLSLFALEPTVLLRIARILGTSESLALRASLASRNLLPVVDHLMAHRESALAGLPSQDVDYLSKMLLAFLVAHKEDVTQVPNSSNRNWQKLQSDLRLQRIALVLNLVHKSGFLNALELGKEIQKNNDPANKHSVDRKTMERIFEELQQFKLVKLERYRVEFAREGEEDLQFEISTKLPIRKLIIIDPDYNLSKEEVEKMEYMRTPFFKNKQGVSNHSEHSSVQDEAFEFPESFNLEEKISQVTVFSNLLGRVSISMFGTFFARLVKHAIKERTKELVSSLDFGPPRGFLDDRINSLMNRLGVAEPRGTSTTQPERGDSPEWSRQVPDDPKICLRIFQSGGRDLSWCWSRLSKKLELGCFFSLEDSFGNLELARQLVMEILIKELQIRGKISLAEAQGTLVFRGC